jgi:hypothetical protein
MERNGTVSFEPAVHSWGAVKLHWGHGRRAAGYLIRSIGANLNASVVDIAIIGAGPCRLSLAAA